MGWGILSSVNGAPAARSARPAAAKPSTARPAAKQPKPPLTDINPKGPVKPGDMSLGKDFFFGTSTSATQVEGGNIDNDIARWAKTHPGWAQPTPGLDHWNRLEQDYAHLEGNGHNAHGFTIDWARIEPRPGVFDQAAIDHYKQEIAICRKDGMEPMVTLMQYALPPWLAAKGGVLAPDAAQRFAEYTRVCAEAFGDQVTWWNTMNEPNTLSGAAYLAGLWPPGKKSPILFMRSLDAQLKMHAAAASVLHDVAKKHNRKAMVGLVFIDDKEYPKNKWNPLDWIVAKLYDYFANRWFLNSLAAGKSIWPVGSGKPIPGLKGSIDYLGLNFYGRGWADVTLGKGGPVNLFAPNPAIKGPQPAFDTGGMYERIVADYNQLHVPVMITESGVDIPEPDSQNVRGRAIVDSLAAIKHAQDDGVPVLGYLHWTDWDSPEWHDGYTQHYGLFGFDPVTGKRWDKPAATTFEAIARRHAIPQQWLTPEDLQSPAARDSHAADALKALQKARQQAS